ncbi:MAG: DUF2975 domain-containing protein [Coriobacteriia bacterium]|nr:DUF2975 domain-containing protein [Coriobacteriia bacterium]
MRKNSFVHYLTKILIDIMFYVGILICLALPFIMSRAMDFFGYDDSATLLFTIVLLASGLCTLFILWELKTMFRTLLGGDPFIAANVSSFRKIAVACFLIALIYVAKSIFLFSLTSVVFIIIFSLAGLVCLTLKDVFKQAIAYKEENDWTV